MQDINEEKNESEGYPLYPESEDIYIQFKKEKDIDPEDVSKIKEKEIVRKLNEKDFNDDVTGSDLDIPGTELEGSEDTVVNEDEENNYYSPGVYDHMDYEDNHGY